MMSVLNAARLEDDDQTALLDNQVEQEVEAAVEGEDDHAGEQSVEARARTMGWVPKDEFRGDPAKWTDAESFLRRGETMLPIVLERNRVMQRRIERLEKENRDRDASTKELLEYSRKSEERAYGRARKELEGRMEVAVGQADTASYTAARAELEQLDKERPAAPQVSAPAAPQPDPTVQQWVADNPWFKNDREMADDADMIFNKLARDQPTMSTSERLAETKRKIMRLHPEKFENQRRVAPAAVAAASPGRALRKTGRSFADLPAEAKVACNRLVKTIQGYTQDDYVRDYDWE